MASGSLSHKTALRDRGIKDVAKFKANYDPIDHVAVMQHRPGRRMIVMSDPDDQFVSFRAQREFVERVKAKGLPILHISADSGQENFHGLHTEAQSLVVDCARSMDDDALVTKYQNKAAPASGGVSAGRAR
jgi:hypothetical protein